MKVTLILKGEKDLFNRYPVYIRRSEGQKRKFKKTKLLLTEDQFKRFKQGEPKSSEMETYKSFLNALDYKEEKEIKTDFFAYTKQCNKEWYKDKSPETLRQHKSEINKLKEFRSQFLLSHVTPKFLVQYKEHLEGLGNSGNTIWKSFKYLRLIILKAYKEKLISENPFDVFTMPKYKDPNVEYITEDDMLTIEEKILNQPMPEELQFAATWFLIGCYSGLRYGDMNRFDKDKMIKNFRLTLYTSKTGEIVSIPLMVRLTGKLPVLLERIDYKPLYYTNQSYNRLLKQIGSICKIATPLKAHTSRHSAAIRWANNGVSQETVAKLLGHQDLKTTAIYFKITGKRIDSELS